jgi:hypothetical protein
MSNNVLPDPLNVNVVSPDPLPVDIVSPLEISDRGSVGIPVFIQDQTTPILSIPFLQTRDPVDLLADTIVNSNTISLVTGHGAVTGDVIEIAETGTMDFIQAEVVSTSGINDVILDSPVNRVYTASGSIAQISSKDLRVDGSVTSQIFSILPLPGQSGDITGIFLEIRGSSGGAIDFTSFGSEAPLDFGIVIRINNGDGTYRNVFNFKSNSDFFEQANTPPTFLEPKGGNTVSGFSAPIEWSGQENYGVVVRIDGSIGESIEAVIQDDLTVGTRPNTRIHLSAKAHELQE